MTTQPRDNDGTRPVPRVTYHAGGQDDDGTEWRRPHRQFSTTGKDSRTYTIFMVDPEVRIYDDPPRVVLPPGAVYEYEPVGTTIDKASPGSRVRGRIIPATFEAIPESHQGPNIGFTLGWVHPPIDNDANEEESRLGIVSLTMGQGSTIDSVNTMVRDIAENLGLPAPIYTGEHEVTKSELRRVPMADLWREAVEMIGVYGVIEKIYKRRPPGLRYLGDDGRAVRIAFVGFDNDPNAPKASRGRKRGATAALHPWVWNHRNVLAIAADCKRQGMTREQTVAHFLAEHGQIWSTASVKKMWAKCREDGLLPKIDKNKTDRGRQ